MPPRIAPDAGPGRGGRGRGGRGGGDRGRGRGGDRGGGRGGERGGWRGGGHGGERGSWRGGERGGERGRGRGFRGEGRGRGDRGGGRGRGNRGTTPGADRGRGRGAGAGAGAGSPPPLPAGHVEAIGVKRPGFGNRGDWITVVSNHVEVRLDQDQGDIYHYDVGQYLSFFDFVEGRTQPLSVVHVVILPENETRSIERNFQIVTALQAQFQGSLSAGVYDGRKNFFSPVVLEIETGAQEFVVLMGAEIRVRLTYVASINPEVLSRFVRGEQSHDEDVLTAIMALNIVIRMEPSLRYPSNKNSFFTNQIEEARPIGAGIVLWRGYFQSLRPAIDRVLINVDTATGTMYKPGRLIDLALEVLGKSTPNALHQETSRDLDVP